jgi:hypothetical protein
MIRLQLFGRAGALLPLLPRCFISPCLNVQDTQARWWTYGLDQSSGTVLTALSQADRFVWPARFCHLLLVDWGLLALCGYSVGAWSHKDCNEQLTRS